MSKNIIISAFGASILIYIASAFYFYNQEENLKSTFLEDIKNANKTGLVIDEFRDTLINSTGDTTFINIPATIIANAEISASHVPFDTSKRIK